MIRRLCPTLLLLVVVSPSEARGQALWPAPLSGRGEFSLEWHRPTFKDESFDQALSDTRGVWVLGARFRLTPRLNGEFSIPSTRGPGSPDPSATESNLGTPYFGVEFVREDRSPQLSFGARFPQLGGGSGGWIGGMFSDFDRWEQVTPNLFSLTATSHFPAWKDASGSFAELRVGGSYLRYTGEGASAPSDFWANFGIKMGRQTPTFGAALAVTGKWLLTPDNSESVADAIFMQAAGDLSYDFGAVTPMVGLRFPFDEDLKEVMKFVLVTGVRVELP